MFRGLSEFGAPLVALVEVTPGAFAAVLTDEIGEPIDYAHYPRRISALDVQLHAAQLSSVLARMEGSAQFGGHMLVVQAQNACLLTRAIAPQLRITLLLRPDCNLGVAFAAFERAGRAVNTLERQ